MIEILDKLDILAQPHLNPETLSLSGVPFGTNAAETVERHRITEVSFSPLVHRSLSGTDIDAEYYGADGQRLPLDEVIDSVIDTDGMVHLADKISYKIVSGTVAGFAIYGGNRGHLAHFGFLRSYEEFLATFGTPERVEANRTFGDLLGYRNYYWSSRKQAYWDTWDGLLSVNLGDYEGNAGPRT